MSVEKRDPTTGALTYATVAAEREITLHDLLRHTAGFTYGGLTRNILVNEMYDKVGVDAEDITNAEVVERLAKVPLTNQPGAAFGYGPYDPSKQFVPVALMGRSCLILAAHESLGIVSLRDLVSRARASPGKLTYATAGRGTGQHLLMEQLKHVANINLVPVHYKGGAPALTDVVAGHIPLLFEYPDQLVPYVRNGPLRAIMAACKRRNELFPTVPTASEEGYPDVGVLTWSGVFAPAGTPLSIVTKLNTEINKILSSPDIRGNASFSGAELPLLTADEFAALINEDRPRWVQLVRLAGVEPE